MLNDTDASCAGLSVLVVDDNRYVRDVVRAILELEGAVVFEAATLGQARACLQNEVPDAILTDLEICADERGGVAILEHVMRRALGCAVLLLTGRVEACDDLRNVGFDAVLLKPTPATTLTRSIRVAFDARRGNAIRASNPAA